MKRILSLFRWLLAGLCLAALKAAEPVPAAAFAARAKQTRERIDLLFRHREDPPPPTGPSQNPFRTSIGVADTNPAPSAVGQPEEPAAPPSSDDSLLRQAVASLKIKGIVKKPDGQINVSISGELYTEGSIITSRVQGAVIYLRIRRITLNSVTFAWNDSELLQPF